VNLLGGYIRYEEADDIICFELWLPKQVNESF
jgi:hypothetical protein